MYGTDGEMMCVAMMMTMIYFYSVYLFYLGATLFKQSFG